MKVVVLHGEIPENASVDELDTLDQVDVVSYSLNELGYKPVALPVSLDFSRMVEELKAMQPDFVFNLVEAINGRGSLIHVVPSILDCLGIPYTGAPTEALFMTSNKIVAKKMLRGAGIATMPWFSEDNILRQPFRKGRYIFKSIWEHASIGIDESSIIDVKSRKQLQGALQSFRERLGNECFAESFIEGREFNIALLAGDNGPQILPPVEVRFFDYPPGKPKILSYQAKWKEDSFEFQNILACFDFTEEEEPLISKMKDISMKCWHLFGIRGYVRVDFRVDQNGKPWVMEINVNPCLSPDGGYAWAVEEAKITFHEAISRIVNDALKK